MAGKISGLLVALLCAFWAAAAAAQTICNGGPLPTQGPMQPRTPKPPPQPDLVIKGTCNVVPGQEYLYRNVNILDGGVLNFTETIDSRTVFWASSIVVENGGTLKAGSPEKPFGSDGGILTIEIYGKAGPSAIDAEGNKVAVADQGKGVPCQSLVPNGTEVPCGIPVKVWDSNGKAEIKGCGPDETSSAADCLPGLPADAADRFYQYGPLYGDGGTTTDGCPAQVDGSPNKKCEGYFGYKTLAVSFGGSLELYGYKGASYDDATNANNLSSGVSWIRLDEKDNLAKGATSLTLERSPGDNGEKWWNKGDTDVQIVVTTTDYLPGHSDELKVTKIAGDEVTFDTPIKWKHVGKRFSLSDRLAAAAGRMTLDPKLVAAGAETRAAVALLTRSIQIVSAGDATPPNPLPTLCPDKKTNGCYYFGAQMVIRQGFKKVQIQGVEFRQMGQGGRMGHYPVHFHMARTTPPNTFVKDSSVNESMNRWYVIHATHGVTLARNVGWKSIGHGYYLEDGDEIDNNFYSNIGIFARGAVDNPQNSRKVPGILSYNNRDRPGFPFRSDNEYPSVFWITNGWNDFIGNMAAGAGTCGACYWLVPAENATKPDVPETDNNDLGYMKWSGYAALQKHQFNDTISRSVPSAFAGATPLKSFYGNSCTSAMHSFQTTQDAPVCHGVNSADFPKAPNTLVAVKSIAPPPLAPELEADDPYYPHYVGARHATRCPPAATQVKGQPPAYDCADVVPCDNPGPLGTNEDQCAVTVLDHYTSAFNWAENGVAAIWLRPQWYLVDNSVLSDVQNAALTFVTSGTYDRAAVIEGDWALARNTVFIGNTQTGNPFASNAGPFNKGIAGSLACDDGATPELYCLNAAEGVSMPLTAFSVAQRFFSIYDGPAYEDSNIFLDIGKTDCNGTDCMYAGTAGVRKDALAKCYLPNAAIAWKQPNGFFYPPAFHSTNLFFDNVAIRHYVIDALFQPNTYLDDKTTIDQDYCTPNGKITSFVNYTDIDRQTELNDDDGSLTGLTNNVSPPTGTISVNPVEFFDAPLKTAECLSNLGVTADKACPVSKKLPATDAPATATTSPYDYVTTAVISECGVDEPGGKPNPGRCEDDTKTVAETCENGDSQCCKQEGDKKVNICIGRFTKSVGRAGTWSQECTNPACYGVPLYRQFLTGNDGKNGNSATREWAAWLTEGCDKNPATVKCRFPFVRMGGQATYQRSTLTANHGTYYLDTTVPRDVQFGSAAAAGEHYTDITPCELTPSGPCQPRSVNVFEELQKYYVYFLYAKRATQQTYQVYVGPNFNVTDDVEAVHADLNTSPVVKFTPETWPATWQRNYNDAVACPKTNLSCGILQVTVDFGANEFSDLDLKAANGLCLPHTFCSDAADAEKAPGKDCGCALKDDDPLVLAGGKAFKQECVKVCGSWAVKDLDFPKDGPWGFSFKMPKGFTPDATLANPSPHRPLPAMFPDMASTGKPDWLTKLEKTKTEPDQSKGECFYPALKIPGEAGCSVIQ